MKMKCLISRKRHSSGYYTQIQIALGLARGAWCDFIVYVYNGLIIVRVKFDGTYFCSVLKKVIFFLQTPFNAILCQFLNSFIYCHIMSFLELNF